MMWMTLHEQQRRSGSPKPKIKIRCNTYGSHRAHSTLIRADSRKPGFRRGAKPLRIEFALARSDVSRRFSL